MAVHAPITGAPSRAPGNLDGISAFMASRRSMLTGTFGAIGATMLATVPAVGAPARGSATDIERSWRQVKASHAALDEQDDTADDGPLWKAIDDASQAIYIKPATSVRDAEICLWCGLLNNGLSDRWLEKAVLAEDIDELGRLADARSLDYEYLFFVRSLQGLRAIQQNARKNLLI